MIGLGLAFSITLVLGGLFSPVAAETQQAAKVARIGFLAGNLAALPNLREAFLQGLRDLDLRCQLAIRRPEARRRARSHSLSGSSSVALPAVQPTRYYLTVNAKTAATLGLTLPPSVLLRADDVVQ
jgi:hypothetical protein